MLQLEFDENSEIIRGIISATDFVPVLRTWWEERHQGGMRPRCHQKTAQSIGPRLCLSWRRGQAKGKSTVDEEERRTAFLEEIRELLERMPRGDVMNADENGVPLLYDDFHRWVRRGAEGGQIRIHGSEKPSYTVTVAMAAGLTNPPIRVTVKGKTTLAEKGSRSSGRITVGSNHTRTGVAERGGHGVLDAEDTRPATIGRRSQVAHGSGCARGAPLSTADRKSGTWRNP
jgi:hypothetical protein